MEFKIIIYSNGCPKCQILEEKLTNAKVKFSKSDDMGELMEMGVTTLPMLKIEEIQEPKKVSWLSFAQAVQWINNQGV